MCKGDEGAVSTSRVCARADEPYDGEDGTLASHGQQTTQGAVEREGVERGQIQGWVSKSGLHFSLTQSLTHPLLRTLTYPHPHSPTPSLPSPPPTDSQKFWSLQRIWR